MKATDYPRLKNSIYGQSSTKIHLCLFSLLLCFILFILFLCYVDSQKVVKEGLHYLAIVPFWGSVISIIFLQENLDKRKTAFEKLEQAKKMGWSYEKIREQIRSLFTGIDEEEAVDQI